MAEGDPYRSDDLSELRALVRSTLGRVTDKVGSMPPSELERLAKALAYFKREAPEPVWPDPLAVLEALADIDPQIPTALDIECSPWITLDNGSATHHLGKLHYVLAKALRIETDNAAPHDIDFWLEGGDMGARIIDRCSITEFRKMTTFEGCVFSQVQPLTVFFEGPVGARVRVVIRSDRPDVTMGPYDGYAALGACAPQVNHHDLCPKCRRYRGIFPGGCTCVTAIR